MKRPKNLAAAGLDCSPLAPLSKQQSLAVMELLYLVGLTDGQFTDEESARLQREIERLPWTWSEGPLAVRSATAQAWQSMSTLSTEAQRRDMVDVLAEQLPPGEIRKLVLRMACSVAGANGVAAEETRILFALEAALGLAADNTSGAGGRP
ncbi:MAG: TerB family tellurite resistance protein [Candidatus Riflebacteria bacterium]|nr:TerB family tellurite resistance protein [Candidatus Riflebacteria bacterium]